ncbi:MAG: sigma-70 family RNA polymerase sigma factor [Gemmataceae bacterium]|nr:sigma-70 family RNA polymerase sigma factor [Gemmataceae bacterium]
MSADPLDNLLEKLTRGDAEAAARVYLTYEPYLRMVVRRHLSPDLRAKFDSMDIVQSVWADLLKGFREAGWRFADATHLRAFLVRLTHHRFIDRLRRHRRTSAREQSLTGGDWEETLSAQDPQPDDLAQADELWQELLDLCPPEHREVLRLKREGALSPEIAARTGLHEGSVRRILCTLSRRLAQRHAQADSGGPTAP